MKVGFGTKFWFGVGQSAEGIKNAALASLLLFYYSQVLGLDPILTGAALMIGVLTDGVSDALVGSLSDSLRHKWGRRHPFMYAAALPFGASFVALFMPPAGLGQWGLFVWLTITVILARNLMTLYVVPHYALGAELSDDHEERTTIVAYRAFFGYLGGGAIFLAARFLFSETPEYAVPQLNPEPYPLIGLIFGTLMALLIFASALGTHSIIPRLPRPPEKKVPVSFQRLWRETRGVVTNKAFRFFLGGFFIWTTGLIIARSLEIYMGTYFWQLTKNQVFMLPVVGMIAMLVGTIFWAWISRKIGKKNCFLYSVSIYCTILLVLPLLKMVGYFPLHGTDVYVATVFVGYFVASFAGGSPPVVAGSMLADIADEYELESGLRQEGIFFGAINMVTKGSAGIGAQIAGVLLAIIGLERQADPSSLTDQTVIGLGISGGLVIALFGFAAVWIYSGYPISKHRHKEIQQALLARNRPQMVAGTFSGTEAKQR